MRMIFEIWITHFRKYNEEIISVWKKFVPVHFIRFEDLKKIPRKYSLDKRLSEDRRDNGKRARGCSELQTQELKAKRQRFQVFP